MTGFTLHSKKRSFLILIKGVHRSAKSLDLATIVYSIAGSDKMRIEKPRNATLALLNAVLLAVLLFFAYNWLDALVGCDAYGGTLFSMRRNIFVQKALLKTLIHGHEKESVIARVKREIEKPENSKTELKINETSLVFGGTKIIFENGRVKDIE